MLLVAAFTLDAQTKSEIKSAKSEASSAVREIKKQKFQMVELGDVQKRMEHYFIKVNAGCPQVAGIAEGCSTANLAKVSALNNAINEYATNSGGFVRGRIASEANTITEDQLDAIVAAYERLVCKELKGELVPYMTFIRKNKKGLYDARVYCVVDVDLAHNARLKSMEFALEESKLAEKYGSQISDWIDEGFEKRQ